MAFVHISPSCSLRGKVCKDKNDRRPVFTFLGIPFAAPPVGNLRFKPPVTSELWNGERDATEYGPMCPQNIIKLRRKSFPFIVPGVMSEDCLYLNVWSPNVNPTAQLPVMVWIHGGAWTRGSGSMYPGLGISSHHDVVYVSINYRLGAFGFLSTGDDVCPGNLGLLDQVDALRWVRKHIARFGGNPDNVTIFGESAGSMSVFFHMLSDMSRGLFRRAISQSGVSTYAGAIWPRVSGGKYLRTLVKKAYGFTATSSKELIDFLRSRSADDLAYALPVFQPVFDGVFLKDHPHKIYNENRHCHVDYMLGFNIDEGVRFIMDDVEGMKLLTYDATRRYVRNFVLNVAYRNNKNVDAMTDVVLKTYGVERSMTAGQFAHVLSDIYGDWVFKTPTIDVANRHSVGSSTYVYHFSRRPPFSWWPAEYGADHTDEILYALGLPFLADTPVKFHPMDETLSRLMMHYWANFAATGDPNGDGAPTWQRYENTHTNYIELCTSPRIRRDFMPQRVKLWNETLPSMAEDKNQLKSKY